MYRWTIWEIGGVSPEEEKERYGGKDLQKRTVISLEWKSEGWWMNESGKSIEPIEEGPLIN